MRLKGIEKVTPELIEDVFGKGHKDILENYFHCENLQFKVINNMFHFRFLPQFKKTETYYDN